MAPTLPDVAINSATNLLNLRDIVMDRAEEEACREIVHRIPMSEKLRNFAEEHGRRYDRVAEGRDVAVPASDPSPSHGRPSANLT
jgi:hypothetical protein